MINSIEYNSLNLINFNSKCYELHSNRHVRQVKVANSDLVKTQLYFNNFEVNPGEKSFLSGTTIATWAGSSCAQNASFSPTNALNIPTSSDSFYAGPVDLNSNVAISFSSSACASSNLTLSYLNNGAWVSLPTISTKQAPPTAFSRSVLTNIDQALPGSYLRLQVNSGSSNIFVDNFAVDCLTLPCASTPSVTLLSTDYDSVSTYTGTGGSIFDSTLVASNRGCAIDGSKSLIFRGANASRTVSFQVNATQGGFFNFKLFTASANTSTCQNTTSVDTSYWAPVLTSNTSGNCVDSVNQAPNVWFNEIVHKYPMTYYYSSQTLPDWRVSAAPSSANIETLSFSQTPAAYTSATGRGFELAGPVGKNLTGWTIVVAVSYSAPDAFVIDRLVLPVGSVLVADPDVLSDSNFSLGYIGISYSFRMHPACLTPVYNRVQSNNFYQGGTNTNGSPTNSWEQVACHLILLDPTNSTIDSISLSSTTSSTILNSNFTLKENIGSSTTLMSFMPTWLPPTGLYGAYVDFTPSTGAYAESTSTSLSNCLLSYNVVSGTVPASTLATSQWDWNAATVGKATVGGANRQGFYWSNRCTPTLFGNLANETLARANLIDGSIYTENNSSSFKTSIQLGAAYYGGHNWQPHSSGTGPFYACPWQTTRTYTGGSGCSSNSATCPCEDIDLTGGPSSQDTYALQQLVNCPLETYYKLTYFPQTTNVTTRGCCKDSTNTPVLLQYSLDGTSWTTLRDFSAATGTYDAYSVALPARARSANTYLRFFQEYSNQDWSIDGTSAWGLDAISFTNAKPQAQGSAFSLTHSASAVTTSTTLYPTSTPGAATPLSIELFVKKGVAASTSTFFSYFVNLTFSSSNVVVTAPGGCTLTSTASLSASGQFVSVVLTSSSLSLYLNGLIQGAPVACTPTGTLPSTVTIYALTETTLELDELRIWSTDQSSVFASGTYLARYLPASQQSLSTLIGYWNFDEGACGRTGSRATISTSACWSLSSAPLYPVFDVAQSGSVLITLDKLGADPESDLGSVTISVYNIITGLGSLYDVNPALPAQPTGAAITSAFTVSASRLTNGLWFYCSSSATVGLSNLFTYDITDYSGSVASSGFVKVQVSATAVLPVPPQAQDLVFVFYSSTSTLLTLPVGGQGTLQIQFPSAPAAGQISGISSYPANLSVGVLSFTYIFPAGAAYQSFYNLSFPYTVCELSGTICSSANVILYRGELQAFDDAVQVPNSEGFPYSFDSLLTNDWIYSADLSGTYIYSVTQPSSGTVSIDASGLSLTYTPPSPVFGYPSQLVNFTYQLKNPLSTSNYATISMNVTLTSTYYTNPVAYPQSLTCNEDQLIAITLVGTTTPAAGSLIYNIDSIPLPAQGFLYLTSSTVNPLLAAQPISSSVIYFRGAQDYSGPASFQFSVIDANIATPSLAQSASVLVSITIDPVNDPPMAPNVTIKQTINTALMIPLGSDVDNPCASLTVTITTLPSSTYISLTESVSPFTPINSPGYTLPTSSSCTVRSLATSTAGTTNFHYSVSDGTSTTFGIITVQLIGLVSGSPTSYDFTTPVNENEATLIDMGAHVSPPTGYTVQDLVFYIDALPSNGVLYETAGDSVSLGPAIAVNNPILFNQLGQIIFVPDSYFVGTSVFQYHSESYDSSNDIFLPSAIAQATLDVVLVPFAPVITPLVFYPTEDTLFSFSISGSDPNSLPLEFSFSGLNALFGQILDGTTPVVAYPQDTSTYSSQTDYNFQPNPNFNGVQAITYQARNSGGTESASQTIVFNITSVNDYPVSQDDSFNVIENSPAFIWFAFSDVDDLISASTYHVTITQMPNHGMIYNTNDGYTLGSAVPGSGSVTSLTLPIGVIYQSTPYYLGPDVIKWEVQDPTGLVSATATLTINVSSADGVPFANSTVVYVNENGVINITLQAIAQSLTGTLDYYVEEFFPKGQLTEAATGNTISSFPYTVAPNVVTYRPPLHQASYPPTTPFSLIYWSAMDTTTSLQSPIAVINVIVNNLNDAPYGSNFKVSMPENSDWRQIVLLGADYDIPYGDSLSWIITTISANGVLRKPDSSGTLPDMTAGGVLAVNDVLASGITSNLVDGVSVFFRPNSLYSGVTTFSYTLQDSYTASSSPIVVTVNVSYVPQPPQLSPTAFSGSEDVSLQITLGTVLAPAGVYTFQIDVLPLHGKIYSGLLPFTNQPQLLKSSVVSSANVIFVPDADWSGDDFFYYTAIDSINMHSLSVRLNITLSSVDDFPRTINQTVLAFEEVPVLINLTFSDTDIGQTHTFAIESAATHGKLYDVPSLTLISSFPTTLTGSQVQYVSDLDYFGNDVVVYSVHDNGATNHDSPSNGYISILVEGVDDPPLGSNQTVSAFYNTPITIVLETWDMDSDNLTLSCQLETLPTSPLLGDTAGFSNITLTTPTPVVLDTRQLSYYPSQTFGGLDILTYRVFDGQLYSPTYYITIDVANSTADPFAYPLFFNFPEAGNYSIQLLASSVPTATIVNYTIDVQPENGTITAYDAVTGLLYYAPNQYFFGPDSFQYHVRDSADHDSLTVSVVLHIYPEPTPAVPLSFPAITEQGKPVLIRLEVNQSYDGPIQLDASGCAIGYSFSVVSLPAIGDLYVFNGYNFDSSADEPFQTKITSPGTTPSCLIWFYALAEFAGNPLTEFEYICTDSSGVDSLVVGKVQVSTNAASEFSCGSAVTASLTQGDSVLITLEGTILNSASAFAYIIDTLPEPCSSGGAPCLFADGVPLSAGSPLALGKNKVTYTPDPAYYCATSGSDPPCTLFTYIMRDTAGINSTSSIEPCSVSISVILFNTPPLIATPAIAFYGLENRPIYINPFDYVYDPQSNTTLHVVLQSNPLRGVIYNVSTITNQSTGEVLNPGTKLYGPIIYQPDQYAYSFELGNGDLSLFDKFSWAPQDLTLTGATQTINLYIHASNNPPLCTDSRISMRMQKGTVFTLFAIDVDTDDYPTNFSVAGLPTQGSLYQYDAHTANYTSPILSKTLVTDPQHRLYYIPFKNRVGRPLDQILFNAADTHNEWSLTPGTVTIDVYANTPPVAGGFTDTQKGLPLSFSGPEDTLIVCQLEGWDFDSDPLSFIITSLPLSGRIYQYDSTKPNFVGSQILSTAAVTDPQGRVLYLPDKNIYGTDNTPLDEYGFKAYDGLDQSKLDSKVEIFVTSVRDDPSSLNITLTAQPQGQSFAIILSGSSVDGSGVKLQVVIDSLPEFGTLSSDDLVTAQTRDVSTRDVQDITVVPTTINSARPKVFYNPDPAFYGIDSFSYHTQDITQNPVLRSDQTYVEITIYHVNSPPVAFSQNVTLSVGEFEYVVLNGTDSDRFNGEADVLEYVVSGLGNTDCEYYQTSDDVPPQVLEPIVATPTTVTSKRNSIAIFTKIANTTCDLEFYIYDGTDNGAPAVIYSASGSEPPSKPAPFPIGAVAGAVAGIGVAAIACAIFFWWYCKRLRARRHSVAGALTQRKSSKDILEKLLMEEGFYVVAALSDVCDPSPNGRAELATALVKLFVSNDLILPLIELLVKKEVKTAKNPAATFGTTSVAINVMRVYAKMVGTTYLQHCLQALVDEVLSKPNAYEVDRSRLQAGRDLEQQWQALLSISERFLQSITSSADVCPIEIRHMCQLIHTEVMAQFPDFRNVHILTGAFLFYRFFSPAIENPESWDLVPPEQTIDMSARRGLLLISKGLKNLSIGAQFGTKEEYLIPMNQFIVANLRNVRLFVEELARPLQDVARFSKLDIEGFEKAEALDVIHKHIFGVQEEIEIQLTHLDSDVTGREYIEHLNVLDYLINFRTTETDIEDIIQAMISDMPLITAVCSTIPPGSLNNIAQKLITIFEAHGLTINLLSQLVTNDISNAASSAMLFRENSTALRMVKAYMEIIALQYLQSILQVTVKLVVNEPAGYEIDSKKIPDAMTLKKNVEHLAATVEEILMNIYNSVHNFPIQIRVLCKAMFTTIQKTHFADRRHAVVADFIFSRLFCPAIVTPLAYGIVEERPQAAANRALLLVTKTIQLLAHSLGRSAETTGLMAEMAFLIPRHSTRIFEFIDRIIDVPDDAADDTQSFLINQDILRDAVYIIHNHIKDTEDQIRFTLTPDARETGNILTRLQMIMDDLGPPIQQSSNQRT